MATKKKPTIKNTKQRAGVILNSILRTVAEEVTEMVTVVGLDGPEDKMVTKAEALVRLGFKHALGFTETRVDDKGTETKIVHPPDRVYGCMIWDRMEGRVAAVEPGKKEKRTIADRVGEQNKKRLNVIAKDSVK